MGNLIRLTRSPPPSPSPSLDGRTDEELMALVRLNARAAFRVLVVRHAEKVASFCARISGDRSAAREIAQSVWLALWDARGRWEPRSRFTSFLYAIAFSRARNHARARRRSERVFAVAPLQEEIASGGLSSGLDQLLALERRERLRAAVDALPAPLREAVVLRFVEELSYEEMAETQNTRASTLRSRVFHALSRLRSVLEEVP
jgi:RNA polymerase sigma-70 factor (ECF subfamily)